ncbi:HNH endonuclease-domain-containing protein [Lipomyces starkeyi]
MAGGRAIGRDVHFYNFAEPDKALGGLILNPSVTEKTFLSMLGILIIASGPYRVTLRSTGHDITPTDGPLHSGHYDIRPYSRRDEPWIMRIISQSFTGRENTFWTEVRKRDGKCVITGTINRRANRDNWTGFHAAHIFPLSSEDYCVQSGFSRWITNKGERDTGINSCQNGLLMELTIHELFDGFYFSINPDDGYKITCFDEDNKSKSARDELLRWHFRQAVLANMRGAGEPSFETDFPPGTDMIGEILSGPAAAKRMEAELSSRLGGYFLPGTLQRL